MTIRVTVDANVCQQYGQCCFEAPEFFEIREDGTLVYAAEVDDDHAETVERAADICPMQAITIE